MKVEDLIKRDKSFEKALKRIEENSVKGRKKNTVFPLPDPEILKFEKEIFEERKTALLMERKDLKEKLAQLKENSRSVPDRLSEFLELAGSAYLSYRMGFPEEKRDLLKIVTSNREISRKSVDLRLSIPFEEVANRFQHSNSGPYRDIPRTWDRLIQKLVEFFKSEASPETR